MSFVGNGIISYIRTANAQVSYRQFLTLLISGCSAHSRICVFIHSCGPDLHTAWAMAELVKNFITIPSCTGGFFYGKKEK